MNNTLKIKIVFRAIKTLKNWPLYFWDYFKLVYRKFIILKLRNGIFFNIRSRTSDRTIFNEIWLNKFYTPPGFEINDKDIVLDIGAHIGFFSVFAAISAKNGMVYSFEPMPDNFRLLKNNINLNKMMNIEPINQAVSCKSGAREFVLSPNNPSGNYLASLGDNQNKGIIIKTVNLDEFVKNRDINIIDFLKMDCEGAEYEILFNCPFEVLKIIKKISMEYHDIDDFRNAAQLKIFLERTGFRVSVNTVGGSMLYAIR